MDFEDLFNTPRKMRIAGLSLAFMLAFPMYFALVPTILDNELIAGGTGPSGDWEVTFTETDIATSESTEFLMDGEEFIFEFTFADQNPNLAYVEIIVSHDETDESGANPPRARSV